MKMQEKWNALQAVLEEMKTMKKREYFLTLTVFLLFGIVIGMLLSPNKKMVIGSYNANSRGNGCADGQDDDCDCYDDCCCNED